MKKLRIALICIVAMLGLCSCDFVTETTQTVAPDTSDVTTEAVSVAENCDEWTAHFINVGKADSILIEADGLFYLIDTGTSDSTDALARVFYNYSVTSVEGVFITHTDKDHIGGLKWLLKKSGVDVKKIYAPAVTPLDGNGKDDVDKKSEKQGKTVTRLGVNDTVAAGKGSVRFRVLGPVTVAEGENNNSMVLRLEGNCASALFMGDALYAEESSLNASDLDADLLKVAHHGSDKATSYEFLEKVTPTVSVISTSTEEKSTTPSPMTVKNLENIGSRIFVTQNYELELVITSDKQGEIQVGK